jgi:hypothetical protein
MLATGRLCSCQRCAQEPPDLSPPYDLPNFLSPTHRVNDLDAQGDERGMRGIVAVAWERPRSAVNWMLKGGLAPTYAAT